VLAAQVVGDLLAGRVVGGPVEARRHADAAGHAAPRRELDREPAAHRAAHHVRPVKPCSRSSGVPDSERYAAGEDSIDLPEGSTAAMLDTLAHMNRSII